ncbi:hypothetical protein BN971_04556 [Mycobacterium bohemicum DSM 44277]|nr:hypothetical protein [Mycobacterium bohemicum]CPR13247.1 hypothetical protein BN971_04556 [Mycobacterium bohemicum DSM 44277]
MTDAAISDEKVSDTEPEDAQAEPAADGDGNGAAAATDDSAGDTAGDAADDAAEDARPKGPLGRVWSRRPRRLTRWATAVLVVAALAGAVVGYTKYQQVSGQLAALRRDNADRDAAARLARDYALKSLTYSFEDPDAFFRSVEDGVSQQLKDKYVNATDVLKSIMLQAQVTSSGEVLATDAVAQPGGGSYQVVVSAHQTTRNLQNPTPKVSIILLQVTVNRAGSGWQVGDIGPKTGSHPPVEQQLPPPEPLPAPGKPAPTR